MGKTSAWKEVLESALKHTETSPTTSPAGNNNCSEGSLGAFSTLIQQALEVCSKTNIFALLFFQNVILRQENPPLLPN